MLKLDCKNIEVVLPNKCNNNCEINMNGWYRLKFFHPQLKLPIVIIGISYFRMSTGVSLKSMYHIQGNTFIYHHFSSV